MSFLSSLRTGLAIVVLACAGNSSFAAPVEVPNAGFENGQVGWTIANGDGGQHRSAIETGTVFEGKNALRLEKTVPGGFVQLQTPFIPIQPETAYSAGIRLNTLPFTAQNPSAANVYFMVSQFKPGSDAMDLPNQFGPARPFYSSNKQWEELKMNFATRTGVDRVRISLIVALDVANLLIDDLKLEAQGKGEYKPRHEPPTPEKLLSQEEAAKILAGRPRATAQVKQVGSRPRLFLDGKESFPAFHLANAWRGNNSQYGDFSKAGVNVHIVPYILGRGVYGNFGVWSGKGQTDFSELDAILWRVLRADPNGYVMFYLVTDPYPAWAQENPDAVLTDQNGNKAIVDMHFLRWDKNPPKEIPGKTYVERYGHSFVSQQLRRDTGEVLRQFEQHVQQSVPGKAVIGYHVIGGNDGQMFQWDDFGGSVDHYSDYSVASLESFRGWLKTHYGTVAALQKAWARKDVTFENAVIPSAERRATTRLFLDQAADQDIVDLNRFRSEGIVDTLNGYAQVLRGARSTPMLLGTYYAGPGTRVKSHQATGYLLEKGLYNYVTSVLTYGDIRWPQGPGKAHQAWSSLLLHNTFGLSEEDFRSWKTNPSTPQTDYNVGRVETAQESNAMIRRDTGHMLAVGQGAWWYDMSGGWFNDPTIMRAVEESTQGYRSDLKDNELPRAEVAVFVDEKAWNHLASNDVPTLVHNSINQQIVELNSSGVPYHIYLQEDVANAKLPEYKLYLFLNAYHLEPKEWSAIQKLRRGNKTLAFVHAPGVASKDLLGVTDNAQAVAKVTGIAVQDQGKQALQLQVIPGNGVYDAAVINAAGVNLPAFAVNAAGTKPIARYANGQTAVAIKDFGNWKSVFFGGVGMNKFFLNTLARQAGAWVAAPAGNAVYASQHFLTIHAMYPGQKQVRLLEPAKVIDMAGGKVLAEKTASLTLDMKRGETRWFRLEKP